VEAYRAQPAYRTDICCSSLTVRLCIRKTLNVCAWRDKVPPCSVSNILDNWLRTVTGVSLSCTAIQAESNELFGVIIKLMLAKKFRKFQRHCCRRFSRDVYLQRLRDGPRHLLVINLMRAAIRGGGCDGGRSWVCKSNAQNCKAAHPPATQKSLASHRDHFTPRMHECAADTAGWNASPLQQLERKQEYM